MIYVRGTIYKETFQSRGQSKQMTNFGLLLSIVVKYSRIIQKILITKKLQS